MNELKQNTEKDWKNYETNNKTIALNVLLSQSNKTINAERENKVILLMITDGEKLHYLAFKSWPKFLWGSLSKNKGNYYCINCLRLFRTESKLKSH